MISSLCAHFIVFCISLARKRQSLTVLALLKSQSPDLLCALSTKAPSSRIVSSTPMNQAFSHMSSQNFRKKPLRAMVFTYVGHLHGSLLHASCPLQFIDTKTEREQTVARPLHTQWSSRGVSLCRSKAGEMHQEQLPQHPPLFSPLHPLSRVGASVEPIGTGRNAVEAARTEVVLVPTGEHVTLEVPRDAPPSAAFCCFNKNR